MWLRSSNSSTIGLGIVLIVHNVSCKNTVCQEAVCGLAATAIQSIHQVVSILRLGVWYLEFVVVDAVPHTCQHSVKSLHAAQVTTRAWELQQCNWRIEATC